MVGGIQARGTAISFLFPRSVPVRLERGAGVPMLVFAGLFAAYTNYAGHGGADMMVTSALVGGFGGLLSLLVHELGHVLAARRTVGVRPMRISVITLGAATQLEGAYRSGRDQIRVALSGPLASFAFAVPLVAAIALPISTPLRWSLFLLAGLNLGLGLAALLPISPLDGHKAAVGILWAVVRSEDQARLIVRRVGICLLTLDLAAGSTLMIERPKIGLLVFAAAVALGIERRFARRRQRHARTLSSSV